MRAACSPNDWKVVPLAAELTTVACSPDPDQVRMGRPCLLALPSGRLIAAFDQYGPGVRGLPGAKGKFERLNRWLQGKIFISTDRGKNRSFRQDFPFANPRLFRDSTNIYLLGHADALMIMRSCNGGETWSKPVELAVRSYSRTPLPRLSPSVITCILPP